MGKKAKPIDAVAYLRTSSTTNVGADKDSEPRQRHAIRGFAKRAGYSLVGEFSDPGVSGADPIEKRRGFTALLDQIESNGCRVVVVEDASRFARDLLTQELGILALIKRHVRVLTANGDDLTDSTDPTRKMMRQIAGAFAEYEKARIVAKLTSARARKREQTGEKCGGRRSHVEIRPDVVALAKRYRRKKPKGGQLSLRAVAAELERAGHLNEAGKRYSATSVAHMLDQSIKQTEA